jgi:L-aspartate oxidase
LLEAAVCGRLAAEDIAGIATASFSQNADLNVPRPAESQTIAPLRQTMDRDVGVVRDQTGLNQAIGKLSALLEETGGTGAEDAVALALLIARAAERREESRGAHFRSDGQPPTDPAVHSTSRWDEIVEG